MERFNWVPRGIPTYQATDAFERNIIIHPDYPDEMLIALYCGDLFVLLHGMEVNGKCIPARIHIEGYEQCETCTVDTSDSWLSPRERKIIRQKRGPCTCASDAYQKVSEHLPGSLPIDLEPGEFEMVSDLFSYSEVKYLQQSIFPD